MTATVSIVVRKAENALRIPASALRFRPEGYQRPTAGTGGAAAFGAPGAARGGGERAAGGPAQWAGRRAAAGGAPAGGAVPNAAAGEHRSGGPGGPGGWKGRPSTVFVPGEQGRPKPVEVRTGVSDGQFVELREGLAEGAPVITGTEIPGARAGGPRPGVFPVLEPLQPPAAAAAAALARWPSLSSGWST